MTVLGIMSGTSLDGIDFALCNFSFVNNIFSFEIIKSQTVEYPKSWIENLKNAQNLNAFEFIELHKNYGDFLGEKANEFLSDTIKPEIISSHGHTIFHQPLKRITFQLGDGAFIAAKTEITTVSDFRNLNTALSGQGAPLVPLGDKLLFSEYKYCINLGGFANISFDNSANQRVAFDICPVNFVINHYSQTLGFPFDKNGDIALSGKFNKELFDKLNENEFYSKKYPKSLGREFVENEVFPLINKNNLPVNDILNTYYYHISFQISKLLDKNNSGKLLITGGGAKNIFLIDLIKKAVSQEIIIPNSEIVDFKEAIIFAFLGFLRMNEETNILKSVTGSKFDNCGGIVNLI